MTVEQLNVIVTAQTEDFQRKIELVNQSISGTIALARSAASQLASISVETSGNDGFTKDYARTAEVSGNISDGAGAAPFLSSNLPEVSGAAANVLSLRSGDTLIGAVSESSDNTVQRPIEVYTTVELDGEKVGESVGLYNTTRKRITNGWE